MTDERLDALRTAIDELPDSSLPTIQILRDLCDALPGTVPDEAFGEGSGNPDDDWATMVFCFALAMLERLEAEPAMASETA